jgi:hypothetical protein
MHHRPKIWSTRRIWLAPNVFTRLSLSSAMTTRSWSYERARRRAGRLDEPSIPFSATRRRHQTQSHSLEFGEESAGFFRGVYTTVQMVGTDVRDPYV